MMDNNEQTIIPLGNQNIDDIPEDIFQENIEDIPPLDNEDIPPLDNEDIPLEYLLLENVNELENFDGVHFDRYTNQIIFPMVYVETNKHYHDTRIDKLTELYSRLTTMHDKQDMNYQHQLAVNVVLNELDDFMGLNEDEAKRLLKEHQKQFDKDKKVRLKALREEQRRIDKLLKYGEQANTPIDEGEESDSTLDFNDYDDTDVVLCDIDGYEIN